MGAVEDYRKARVHRDKRWAEEAYVKMRLAAAALVELEGELAAQRAINQPLLDQNELFKAENERLKWMLRVACGDLADHESVWRNADTSPPFKMVESQEIMDDLESRWEKRL